MAMNLNLEGFSKGESVRFSFDAKDHNGDVITSPGSQTYRILISATEKETPFVNSTDGFTVTDVSLGRVTAEITPATLTKAEAGIKYHYNVWTEYSGTNYHQITGRLVLKPGGK